MSRSSDGAVTALKIQILVSLWKKINNPPPQKKELQ
jgi:hypothetical protein